MIVKRRPVALFLAVVAVLLLYRGLHAPTVRQPNAEEPSIERVFRYVKTSFDWANLKQAHPVERANMTSLPTGKPLAMPPVQYDFRPYSRARNGPARMEARARRDAVLAAFEKSWGSYKKYAWGADELTPNAPGKKTTFGGLGATLVDALDSLWIMGLHDDFYSGVQYVAELDFMDITGDSLNLFETTIRYLGGMLSAYDLSGEDVLLRKSVELGDMLYAAFDTPNRMPGFWLNLRHAQAGRQEAGINDAAACPTSLSLEFTRLAQLTGDDKYYDAIDRVTAMLERVQYETRLPGMWPSMMNFRDETADHYEFTLGALADSLYEYLPKMHALLGGLEPRYEKLYRGAIAVVEDRLLFRPMLPNGTDVLFSGNVFVRRKSANLVAESQHLTCFAGGMFGLGGRLFGIDHHVGLGERLARGCAWAYSAFPTGLMPEISNMVPCDSLDGCEWDEEVWQREAGGTGGSGSRNNPGGRQLPPGFKSVRDPRYILRPEAIESLFILYRMTGKEEFRESAWAMFQSIMAATETPLANSAIADVNVEGETKKMDSMESFWLSETLKYFYLIFSPPDIIGLDEFVFNTEAHPLRRPTR